MASDHHRVLTLEAHHAQLLVVDIQEKLLPHIDGNDAMVGTVRQLVRAAGLFGLPVTVSEQYKRGLGETDARINEALGEVAHARFEKTAFGCMGDEKIRAHLAGLERRQAIVCGIETHVCVQQTVLAMLRHGWDVWVCADAVGSRYALDYDVALLRMQQAGAAVTTTESVMFELAGDAKSAKFRGVLELVKEMEQEMKSGQ